MRTDIYLLAFVEQRLLYTENYIIGVFLPYIVNLGMMLLITYNNI